MTTAYHNTTVPLAHLLHAYNEKYAKIEDCLIHMEINVWNYHNTTVLNTTYIEERIPHLKG